MKYFRTSINYFLNVKSLNNKSLLIPKFGKFYCENWKKLFQLQTNFFFTKSFLFKSLKMDETSKLTGVKYLEDPEKSNKDKKVYRNLILSNNMQCLLVSDPSTLSTSSLTASESNFAELYIDESDEMDDDAEMASLTSDESTSSGSSSEEGDEKMAACCMQVAVGSFSEPRKYHGLAHLLEHMVFMGSEKYPGENAYDVHIKKYGGFANANTEDENTLYYFEIPDEHLDSTMDYFSALMKAPLMLKEAITRERRAVESEFQETKQDDDVRRDQILATLGNKEYPHYRFSWGNLKSLEENVDDDDLTKTMHEFFKRHYSGHRMFLCVQARLSIDEMEKLVVKHFSIIPTNNLPAIDFKQYDYRKAFTQDFYKYVYFMKPVQKINRVELTWVLPPMQQNFKCKPDEFIAYLIGYEGAGSLTAYLRKRLWVLELLAGNDDSSTFDSNDFYFLFNLCIVLTDEGFRHLDEVLEASFAYIKLFTESESLKSIYNELQLIEFNNFRFASQKPAFDNVQKLVHNLKRYQPKYVLSGSELYFEYDKDQIQEFLQHLNEFKFNLMITSNLEYEGRIYDKKEKWFDTDYGTMEMPEKWRDMWENSKPIAELFVPLPNEFIPKDFRIFWEENGKPEIPNEPKKILQNDLSELWYKQDDKFLLPEAYIYFEFISPLPRYSPKNDVMCSLLKEFIEFSLAEELYPAASAGINYSVTSTQRGLLLKVYGYNDKLSLLVDTITKTMVTMSAKITESQLEIFKIHKKKDYFNALIKPKNLNRDLLLAILIRNRWQMIEKLEVVSSITLQEMQEFCDKFSNELYVKALMQGNMTEEIAHNVMNTVLTTLNSTSVKNNRHIQNRCCQIPKGAHYLRCKNLNNNDGNTVICNYYEIGPCSLEMECQLDLLFMFVDEPLFDTLRTKENLGYNLSSSSEWNHGISGYTITVHSQEMNHSATHVDKRVEVFHGTKLKILEDVSDEEFEKVRDSQIKIKQIVDLSLSEEMDRNWTEITSDEYVFDRHRREIEILRTITKQNMIDFWTQHQDENFRKLSVQIIGNKQLIDKESVGEKSNNDESNVDAYLDESEESTEMSFSQMTDKVLLNFIPTEDEDQKAISDLTEFKNTLYIYPVMHTEIVKKKIEENSELIPTRGDNMNN